MNSLLRFIQKKPIFAKREQIWTITVRNRQTLRLRKQCNLRLKIHLPVIFLIF